MSTPAISLAQLEGEFLRCYSTTSSGDSATFGGNRRGSQSDLTDDQRRTCRPLEEIGGYELAALHAMPQRYVVSALPETGLTSQLRLLLPSSSLGSAAAVQGFGATCEAIPALLEQSAAALEAARARGQTPIGHLVVRAIDQIEQYLALPPGADPHYAAHARRRPVYETTVLTHHESVPGDHLESAKTLEASSSALGRLLGVLPFYEGWCLYMEGFTDELGLCEDAVSRLGMLSFALWRSCRLVVDTGIHQLGWSRGKAVRYLWQNTTLTRRNVSNEVDRYIAHPGSALGYMVGCLAIRELRRRLAVDTSNSSASRAFHTDLLRHGQLTLGLIGEAMGLESRLEIAEAAFA